MRPIVSDAGIERPVDPHAALADLKALRARSTTQFRDVVSPQGEAELEDLADPFEMSDGYEPSEPIDDRENRDGDLPGALLFHRQQGNLPMSARTDGSPSTDVPECPPPEEEEHKRTHEDGGGADEPPEAKRPKTGNNIPIPDDDKDWLVIDDAYIAEVEGKILPDDWCLVNGEFELDEAFIANLGHRKSEARERDMSLEEKELMIQAKQKELQSFFSNHVWEFAELGKQHRDRMVTARWVLTWKPPEEGSLQRRAKARLVLRGYEDPDVFDLNKTSPTANKNSKMLVLALSPILGWTVFCGDVRAAFLSGSTFDRIIIVKLPSDCSAMLGCVGPTFMKMKKSAYGLSDAPLLWWTEADRRLRSLKLVRHRLDKCAYMIYSNYGKENQKLVGLLILHVDDILLGIDMRDAEAVQKLDEIKGAFDFGKWQELTDKQDIIYCGGRISRKDSNISLDFESYIKKVMPITIHKGRGHGDVLTPAEVSKARALIGALQWPAGQGCPYLSASTSLNAANINKATVELLLELNKTLRFGKSCSDFKINLTPVCEGIDDLCFLCFSDAAFNVRSDGSSQGGYVIVLTSKKALKGEQVAYNLLSWRSFKLNRICRSSLSAESQACATALDELMMIKTMVALILDPNKDPLLPQTAADCGESAIIIDAKALYDSLKKDGIGSAADKRAGIEILCIKEEIQRLKTWLRWVSSERMLADGMTKITARQNMYDMLKSGLLCLVQDDSFKASKKKTKTERQTSAAKTFGYSSSVASRIASVIALDHVSKTAATSDDGDMLDNSYAFDFALIVTAIAIVVGFVFLMYVMYKSALAWFHDVLVQRKMSNSIIATCRNQIKDLKEQLADARERLQVQIEENERLIHDFDRRVGHARRDALQWDRQLLRLQAGVYHFTPRGRKAHLFRECHTLQGSQEILSKEGLCSYCWGRLVEQTTGELDMQDEAQEAT